MQRRDFLRQTASAAGALSVLNTMPGFAATKSGKRPNMLLIMADDMGYSDLGCYGGEIETPNIDEMASKGLRFTQHYSCGRCWPSRACILTGYYPQQIRRDSMKGIGMGPRPSWAPLLPEMLKECGYKSYHSGKWHIDGSPVQGGFNRSWGRNEHGCDWDRFFDSKPWKEGKYTAPVEKGESYYSSTAIADHAIACLKLHEEDCPDKPFFQYVAFYSPHFPLHAPQEDIERYHDRYKVGWDKIREQRHARMKKMGLVDCDLSELDSVTIPDWNMSSEQLEKVYGEGEVGHAVPWNTLNEKEKDFQARKMEVHAAMISRMDLEVGRLIEQLKKMGEYDNTLILIASDNGASAEQINRGDKHTKGAPLGSAKSYVCLGPGWSSAANTPFRLHKHWNHEGGISSPLVVHWPRGLDGENELRRDPSHFVDIVPTMLEVAGCERDQDFNGISLVPAFRKDGAIEHDYLWWCHAGNRAIRVDDWKLVAGKGRTNKRWELFNLAEDRSETNDLKDEYPEKAQELARKWESVGASFKSKLKRDKGARRK